MVQGYCMKCRTKTDMVDAVADKMANGRDCVKGTCSVCSTKMFKIGKMDPEPAAATTEKKAA